MKKFACLISILFVVNLLWMNHAVTLWDEDEAAYAGFGIEMLESGDWVNPEYHWSIIHRKTPFHFWTIAISYQIFGINEFAVRFPSVLAILFTCLLVYRLGRSLFGEQTALWAAIILATSVQLPLMGKIAFTDATLLLFETLAVLSLLNYLYQPSWKWNVGLWFGIAMGILVKGPPVILLLGGMWVLLAIFHPNRKNLVGTHPWFYGLFALLPFAYWCYLSYSQDYALWQSLAVETTFEDWWQEEINDRKIHLLPFLWQWYVVDRVGGAVLGQTGFPGYHFVILTIAFLTWLPLWFTTVRAVLKSFVKPSDKQLVLLIWVIMGWFFWELMSSKLPSYSMAAQPALAFFMAMQLEKQEKTFLSKLGLGLYLFIFSIVIIGLPFVGNYLLGAWTLVYLIPMSLILGIALGVIVKQQFQENVEAEKLYRSIAVFGGLFMFLLWTCVSPIIEQSSIKSFDEVVETAYKLSGNNPKTRLIFSGLDFKQMKISLLVYTDKKFEKYEELNVEQSMQAFKDSTSTTLIIGQNNLAEFKNIFEQNGLPFSAQQVLYRSTDDALKEHNFWVISNEK